MKPNCNQCQYYYITFDKNLPRGCKAYGIKSASMPNQVIKQANSGADCLGFKPKPSKKTKKDLNDPKYWSA